MRNVRVLVVLYVGLIVGCESEPSYHLRQLRWHGKESKNADRQQEHADALVKCGESAVPMLIDEIRLFKYDQQRYSPSPILLLQRIGKPAIAQLRREIDKLQIADGSEESLREQRLVLIATLVLIDGELDHFDQWLAVAEDASVDWQRVDGRAGFLLRLEDYFKGRFPEAPLFLKATVDDSPSPVSQEFKAWWDVNWGEQSTGRRGSERP